MCMPVNANVSTAPTYLPGVSVSAHAFIIFMQICTLSARTDVVYSCFVYRYNAARWTRCVFSKTHTKYETVFFE